MATPEEMKQLRADYLSATGKNPSPNASAGFLKKAIDKATPKQEEPEAPKEEAVKEDVIKPAVMPEEKTEAPKEEAKEVKFSEDEVVYNGEKYPATQGKLYAIILMGKIQYKSYYTVRVLAKSPKLAESQGFALPKGSLIDASEIGCQTCGQ